MKIVWLCYLFSSIRLTTFEFFGPILTPFGAKIKNRKFGADKITLEVIPKMEANFQNKYTFDLQAYFKWILQIKSYVLN